MPAIEHYEDRFVEMARSNPSGLLELLFKENISPADLTFAASAAGDIPDSELVVPMLLKLLEHKSAIVREGAIYGLSNYLPSDTIYDKFRELRSSDHSTGVRETLAQILDSTRI